VAVGQGDGQRRGISDLLMVNVDENVVITGAMHFHEFQHGHILAQDCGLTHRQHCGAVMGV